MRLFTLSLISACFPLFLSAQITDRLEAYFSFEGCNGMDQSGNGSNASLINSPACVCGLGGTAIRFSDPDDEILIPGPVNQVFTTSDFTVSFYFNPQRSSGLGGNQVIMSKQGACDEYPRFWIRYQPSLNRISAGISENASLTSSVSAVLKTDDCWQWVAVSRSNRTFTLYVDGKAVSTSTASARLNLTDALNILSIGQPVCPSDLPFKGDIDEIRFYSRTLSADEDGELPSLNLRPDVILNRDTLLYLGNSMLGRTSPSCATSYRWTPSAGLSDSTVNNPVITPTVPTTYVLRFAHDTLGCIASDTLFVNVIDPDTLDCNQIFLPNAFTPFASAQTNDRFGISNPFSVQDFDSFEIFDRWGGKVFSASSPFETWDGTFNGTALNPGVYLYRLNYRCEGQEKVKSGTVTLLR